MEMNMEDSLPLGKETGLGSPSQLVTNYQNMADMQEGDRLRNLAVSQVHSISYFNKRFKRFLVIRISNRNKGGVIDLWAVTHFQRFSVFWELCFSFTLSLRHSFVVGIGRSRSGDCKFSPSILESEEEIWQDLSWCTLKWVRELWLEEGAANTGSKPANNMKLSVRVVIYDIKKGLPCRLWSWRADI